MAREPRELKAGFCYHITIRCNNREFRLTPSINNYELLIDLSFLTYNDAGNDFNQFLKFVK